MSRRALEQAVDSEEESAYLWIMAAVKVLVYEKGLSLARVKRIVDIAAKSLAQRNAKRGKK